MSDTMPTAQYVPFRIDLATLVVASRRCGCFLPEEAVATHDKWHTAQTEARKVAS